MHLEQEHGHDCYHAHTPRTHQYACAPLSDHSGVALQSWVLAHKTVAPADAASAVTPTDVAPAVVAPAAITPAVVPAVRFSYCSPAQIFGRSYTKCQREADSTSVSGRSLTLCGSRGAAA